MALPSTRRGAGRQGVEIARASIDDAPVISAILLAAFREFESLYAPAGFSATTPTPEEIGRRLSEGPSWIARLDGCASGTVSAVASSDEIYIRSMAVMPSARGRGLGAALLDAVEAFARARRVRRLRLTTTPFLREAIRLYERAGFRRDGSRLELHGTPLFAMTKEIGGKTVSRAPRA